MIHLRREYIQVVCPAGAKEASKMPDVLSALFIGVVALTILAAIVYIVGFAVSALLTIFTVPYEAVHHRHHSSMS